MKTQSQGRFWEDGTKMTKKSNVTQGEVVAKCSFGCFSLHRTIEKKDLHSGRNDDENNVV